MFSRIISHLKRPSPRLKAFLTPYDTSTEEGRSKERYRRAGLTATSSLISRGLLALVSLVSVPLTISYLGKERYGMWIAINVLLTWAVVADFGIGRGLLNQLSDAMGKEDRVAARRAVSTALIALTLLALLFLGILIPLAFLLPWGPILNITDLRLLEEAPTTVAAVFLVFILGFPLGAVSHIYSALQRGYVANLFTMAGSVMSLVSLLVVIRLELGLPYLVLALGGVSVLAKVLNLAWALKSERWLSPRLALFDAASVRSLTRLSTPLFVYQVGAVLVTEMQALVLAHTQGLEVVADYGVLQKVLTIPAFVVGIIEAPFGPALREAFARGDRAWLSSAFWRLQWVKFGLSLLALVFFVFFGNMLCLALIMVIHWHIQVH